MDYLIEDQMVNVNTYFEYQIPSNLFVHQQSETFTQNMSLSSPSEWLEFNNQTFKIYGTPLSGNQGSYVVDITASTDIEVAQTQVTIEVYNHPPKPAA